MADKEKDEVIFGPRFNIFEKVVQDKSVVASSKIEYHPLSQLSPNASVIEFCVSGDGQSYLELLLPEIYFYGSLTGSLKDADGIKNADL